MPLGRLLVTIGAAEVSSPATSREVMLYHSTSWLMGRSVLGPPCAEKGDRDRDQGSGTVTRIGIRIGIQIRDSDWDQDRGLGSGTVTRIGIRIGIRDSDWDRDPD
ncbi:hypothetical protein TURU_039782 [Turdus rufiventris]|nr:hypothetical protein TURU_039782 [Turdus rufiventris]